MQRGFTLIEILIVFAIITIIAGVGVYSFLGYHQSQQVEDEARSLVAFLKSAQEKSIDQESSSRWGVYFDTLGDDRDSYYLYQVDEDILGAGGYTEAPGSIMDQRALRSNLTLGLPAAGITANVIFQKNSGLPVSGATVQIISEFNPAFNKTVSVSTTGLIDYQ